MNNTVKFNKSGTAYVTFFKWDYGQVLSFDNVPADSEVHFPVKESADTVTVKVIDNTCSIPDSTLTLDKSAFDAWLYIDNGAAGRTKKIIHFTLIQRAKPDDHIYNFDENQMLDYKNKLDKFQGTENVDKFLAVNPEGYVSLKTLKAQQALNDGKLKDIIVVKTIEEYDALFDDEEYVTNLKESLQEGECILFFFLGAELDDGRIETIISPIVKENDELVFYDGFSTDAIREEIREAVRPIEKELEAIKPKIDNKLDRAFELKHNCEHRRPEPYFFTSTWLQLSLPSAIPDDYISSLVFNSGNEPTILNYPQTILFTGDDCIDNVFVPKANTTYNVMFWYDGINVNAVSRGVPYAQE